MECSIYGLFLNPAWGYRRWMDLPYKEVYYFMNLRYDSLFFSFNITKLSTPEDKFRPTPISRRFLEISKTYHFFFLSCTFNPY